jgi:TrmH family RNA methyltransferase
MLSKSQAKYIRSLAEQKYRKENNAYPVEGDKLVKEWLSSPSAVHMVVGLAAWMQSNEVLLRRHPEAEAITVKPEELAAVSSLKTPNQVLLVAEMPEPAALPTDEWCLALDTIQDPGNLGTIIRIADWFGIRHVVCSPDCVDAFNAKVIQAAMGGHLRVKVHKTDIRSFIAGIQVPVIAASLSGSNVYEMERLPAGVSGAAGYPQSDDSTSGWGRVA